MTYSIAAVGNVPSAGTEVDCLWMPAGYQRDGSIRGVVYCHGAGETAVTPLGGSLASKAKETALLQQVASVYPMVMFDAGVAASGVTQSDNWGSANAVTRMGQAVTWLQTPWTTAGLGGGGAATGKVLIVCISMGHILAMNYAQANPSKVAGILGILPATDLDNIRDVTAYQASISAAWATGAWSAPGTPPLPSGANPATPANYSNLLSIPHRMYYASDDAIVSPSSVTTLAAGIGAAVSTVNLGVGGHSDASIGHVPVLDVLAFLAANA